MLAIIVSVFPKRVKIGDRKMNVLKQVIAQITNRSARIAIVGLGYVGLPLVMCFHDKGFPVIGIDIDKNKIDCLLRGESYLQHITPQRTKALAASERFAVTGDFSCIVECDAVILCVPTPLGKHQEPDLSFILDTMRAALPYLRAGQIVSLESTTYPGTTEEELRPLLEKQGLRVGKDIFLVFSPEREDPGREGFSTATIPKVVGGVTEACCEAGEALYSAAVAQVVPVSSARVAELTKLLENIYRAVNIGLVNELKIVADCMDIDIREVIDAAATKPFGYTPFYPGPGLGGHCIPIDPFYLTWKAKEYGVHTKFIELAGEVNQSMPEWVLRKIQTALNQRKQSLKGARILVVGLAYKKNVSDLRESPAMQLLDLLYKEESDVAYHDPYVPKIPKIRKYNLFLQSLPLTKETIEQMDCIVLITDHDCIDYDQLYAYSRLLVDTRGRYRKGDARLVKA